MATAENFKITLQNETHAEIKVTKFEYKDGSKFKTENMFGVDGNHKIEPEHGFYWRRDLGGIGDECTQFRVTYQHHFGDNEYGNNICHLTGSFIAHDNGEKVITLTR